MVKVIINTSYSGFKFSYEQITEYNKRTGGCNTYEFDDDLRFDTVMIDIIQNSGLPNAQFSDLKVKDIPQAEIEDDVSISDYDGSERAYFSTRKATKRKLASFNENDATLEECRDFIRNLKKLFRIEKN